MRISTRARISAGIVVVIALIFTTISLFTCHWLDFEPYGMTKYSKGLFSQSSCTFYSEGSPTWNTVTFALMITAFSCEIIVIILILATSFLNHHSTHHLMKLDVLLCLLIFATQTASLITFGVSATNFWDNDPTMATYYNLSWSYWLVIPGAVFGILAIGPLSHAVHAIHHSGEDCYF